MDTLSQSELDALLNALSPVSSKDSSSGGSSSGSGGFNAQGSSGNNQSSNNSQPSRDSRRQTSDQSKDKEKIEKDYDFRRQTKFSKDQLNTLHLIHETFVRLMGTDLSGQLRSNVQANLISVEQRTFEEFMQAIYDPTFITVFNSDTLEGQILIDMNLNIVFCFLDRLLGGSGVPLNTLRQLTEVEKQIIQNIMIRIIDKLRESWLSIVDLAPVIKLIESNPQFAQIASPTSICIAVAIEVKIHDITGMMNLCIPYSTIQPIVHKLRATSWFTAERNDVPQTQTDILTTQVRDIYLNVVAELFSTTLTFSDIVSLEPGSIIEQFPDSKNISEPINVKVGNLVKFKAMPGILGKKMAISITQVIDPNDEMKDDL